MNILARRETCRAPFFSRARFAIHSKFRLLGSLHTNSNSGSASKWLVPAVGLSYDPMVVDPPSKGLLMPFDRSFLPIAGGLLILAGCSSMQNTVAQDLAWERWQKCNHFRGITLKDIKPDGQIWVWRADGGEITAWRECDAAVRAEQAKGVRSTIPSSAVAVASTPPTNSMSVAPIWRPGDEWAFRYESPTGSGTYVWSVDREEVLDGVPQYVIKTGTREIF